MSFLYRASWWMKNRQASHELDGLTMALHTVHDAVTEPLASAMAAGQGLPARPAALCEASHARRLGVLFHALHCAIPSKQPLALQVAAASTAPPPAHFAISLALWLRVMLHALLRAITPQKCLTLEATATLGRQHPSSTTHLTCALAPPSIQGTRRTEPFCRCVVDTASQLW